MSLPYLHKTSSNDASQLWDLYTSQGIQSLESIQKFACKVCLKQWDLDYKSAYVSIATHSTTVNSSYDTTTYIIVANHSYFSPEIFLWHDFPYNTYHQSLLDLFPVLNTCSCSSFVPSVITAWNTLPNR